MWRVICAVALVVGCQHAEPEARRKAEPPPPAVMPADATTVVSADASASPSDAATPMDAGVDAAPSASSTKVVERKGEGTCKSDAECGLSTWQEGCCLSTCTGYAINKKLLAARIAKENCPSKEKHVCPPPAPCPLPDFFPDKAVCKSGTCTAVGHTAP